MADSMWLEEIQKLEKEERQLVVRLRVVRSSLATYREAMAAEVTAGDTPSIPEGFPAINDLPTTEAVRRVLEWHARHGRHEITVEELFNSMKPFRVLTALRENIWESTNPWKTFTASIGKYNADIFCLTHTRGKRTNLADTISLVEQDREAAKVRSNEMLAMLT